MELWTLFTSPRWLNTKFLPRVGNEHDDFLPILIIVKTEGLDCLNLRNTEDLGALYFPILLNRKGRCYDVDGYSLLGTDDFEFDVVLATISLLASFAVM